MTKTPEINTELAAKLVATQFPKWQDLPITPVTPGGHDNRTFHLGEEMSIRMPSSASYAVNVEKEQHWLPKLESHLPLAIPKPVAMGKPGSGYPWRWSIYRWLPGEPASTARISSLSDFALKLGGFLKALHRIDASEGPAPGKHNFHRGGSLEVYDAQTRQAISALGDKIDGFLATEAWEFALSSKWEGAPVWIHGDISSGNLLVQDGELAAVIDFGQACTGDPACDLAIAWSFFDQESRDSFRSMLPLDPGTWARGRAWALWKFLIVTSGATKWDAPEAKDPWRVISAVLKEHQQERSV